MSEENTESKRNGLSRRHFLELVGGTAAAALVTPSLARAEPTRPAPETSLEAPSSTSNLASLLQSVEIPDEFKDQYQYVDYFKSNTPGTLLSDAPENIPGFSGFDPRPGPKVAYFETPGIKNADNRIMYQGSDNIVRYMKLYTSYFPGGENRMPKIEDIQNQYGEPDEPAFVNAIDPNYKIWDYGTKGFVIWQPNFGHDGSEAYAYIFESFEPLPAKGYLDKWGRDQVAVLAGTSGR